MDDFLQLATRLLLEDPWPLGGGLALVGVVLMVSGYTRRHRRLITAGATAWGLMLAILILSAAVTTPREQVGQATRTLLKATVSPADMTTIQSLLHQEIELRGPDDRPWLQADQLLPQMEQALTRWPVHGHRVRDMDIHVTAGQAEVELHLSTRTGDDDAWTLGTGTRWRLTWERDAAGQWQLHTIHWLEWMGREPLMGMWQ